MELMQQIHSGKQSLPPRIMIYGQEGVGKSTCASQAPKPIFIQTEDGLSQIACDKFPFSQSLDDVLKALGELYTEDHLYQTVVVDSLDWLERLIWDAVCREYGVKSIEKADGGYAKGYVHALTHWREVLSGLDALRGDKGMAVILVAHARIERFENPETETYDRYVPRLHKLASAVVQEWCDEVLFASYKIHTKQTEEGFNRKRAQGIGTGERIIRTTERPAHMAKNRLNLPDELPLDWAAYAQHLTNGKTKGGK